MNQNILEVPFWKVVLRFFISFLVLLTIVLTTMTYFRNGNFDAITESINDGSWITFVLYRIGLALVYGIAMTYFSKRKAKNNLRR